MKSCHTRIKLAALILSQCMTSIVLFAQSQSNPTQQDSSTTKFQEANAYANTKLTYKIIDAPNHTFCYDIYADGKLMIHQTSIPGLPGNEGFKTKQDASKVVLLVIEKIKKACPTESFRRGQMPPTISIDEMKKINVIQ